MEVREEWGFPSREIVLENEAVVITAVDVNKDLHSLFTAASIRKNCEDLFRYHVNVSPMSDEKIFEHYLKSKLKQSSEVVYKIFSKRLNEIVGCASLMNVRQEHGSIEVGSIWYSKEAQRTEVNTNAMYLIFCYVFEMLEYRRLEWKCNSRNEASMNAAVRLGFIYEGLFRQHVISRGENRDTAWYSIIDSEWSEKKGLLNRKIT
jgi:RimJ/RimL family protein N-acetyltransferase